MAHNATPGLLDDYLTEDEAAKEVHKHPRTLKRWEARGFGPPITYIGRSVYYHIPGLRRWLAEQERSPKRPEAPRRGRPRKKPLRTERGDAAPLAARSAE